MAPNKEKGVFSGRFEPRPRRVGVTHTLDRLRARSK